ncbi:MAG: ABC transporter substrate-binding protein [bacterium]|nr:ABC transporter substrate-binding protein [bacterium]
MRYLCLSLVILVSLVGVTWAQTPGGSLTVAILGEPPVLDPTASTSMEIARVFYDNVLQGLVKFNVKGEIIPALAESWKISPGGLTYTFALRQNVKFHDGSAFTAQDVLFKFERARDAKSGHMHPAYYRDITKIETPNATTVVFRLKQPNSEFMMNLARPESIIGPKNRVEEQKTHPIGTGPFKFVAWERGVGIRLEKFGQYYVRGRPYLDRVTFRFVPDQGAQLAALRAGDLDVLGVGVIPENALFVQQDANLKLITGTTTTEITVGMNNARPPFDDVRVRRAMQYAVNKDELVRAVMMGFGTKIGSHRSPGEWCYVDLSGMYLPDAARARALLSEAGYGPDNPLSFTFTLAAPYPYERRIGEAISAQLARVGVRARIEVVEWATWLSRVFRGADYQMTIIGHSEPNDIGIYANPDYYFRYNNTRFQETFSEYQRINDTKRACDLMKDLQRMLAEDAVNVWVMNGPYVSALRRNVMGWWTDQPTPSMNVTEVYLQR